MTVSLTLKLRKQELSHLLMNHGFFNKRTEVNCYPQWHMRQIERRTSKVYLFVLPTRQNVFEAIFIFVSWKIRLVCWRRIAQFTNPLQQQNNSLPCKPRI